MPSKHAVFLRGHQRVWLYSKTNIFKAIAAILGENVDWYVAMWESNSTDYNRIVKTFEGKNLIHLELINQSNIPIPEHMRLQETLQRPEDNSIDMFHPHWNLAFLDQVLNAKKCEHELKTGVIYDKVLFTRPDVGFIVNSHESRVLDNFECASYEGVYFIHNYDIYMMDLYYICNSITADIVASRFLNTFITDPTKQFITPSTHTFLAQHFQQNHLILTNYEGVIPFIVRPNTLYMLSKPDYTHDDHVAWDTWGEHDFEQRMKFITDLGIDPNEYL